MKTIKIYKGLVKISENLPINDQYYINYFLKQSLDRNEVLLQKLNDETYKNLTSSKTYNIKDLDLENLVPINKVIKCGKRITKHKAVKLYKKKLNEKLPIKNLFIGNIGLIYDSIKEEQNSNIKIELKCHCVKRNALLLKNDNTYQDLETYINYPLTNICIGQKRIIESHPFINHIIDDEEIEEKMELFKILNKYSKKIK